MGADPSAARPGIVVMVRVLTRARLTLPSVGTIVSRDLIDARPDPVRHTSTKPTVPRQLPVQDSIAVREGRTLTRLPQMSTCGLLQIVGVG